MAANNSVKMRALAILRENHGYGGHLAPLDGIATSHRERLISEAVSVARNELLRPPGHGGFTVDDAEALAAEIRAELVPTA